MVVFISSGLLLIFVLLGIALIAGSALAIIEFFFKYWIYFAVASLVLLIIRTIVAAVRSYEKWHSILYFIFELIRIPLTYLTLVWFANDWLTEVQNSIILFLIKAGVEGIFVLAFVGIATMIPWIIFASDDLAEDWSWVLPLISIVFVIIPLALRMLIEYINTGAAFPVELFSKLIV